MKQFLRPYGETNVNRQKVNYKLMRREYDAPLVDFIIDACKSLEIVQGITFTGYEYEEDESKIDVNDYISTRSNRKKDQDIKYIYLHDNRISQLKLKFNLNYFDKQTKTFKESKITKKIMVPVPDEDGYLSMKGKKFLLLYQLTEASTYNTMNSVVLKSLLPVEIQRSYFTFKDIDSEEHSAPIYSVTMFFKPKMILPFYFATFGMNKTLQYFNLDSAIDFVDRCVENDELYIYYRISNNFYLRINRRLFEKHKYLKTMTCMIIEACSGHQVNKYTMDNLTFWKEWLGAMTSTASASKDTYLEKGINILTFFNRMVDITTQKILKLHLNNKADVFAVVRWMIQNFDGLRKKDNQDLNTKRLRANEFCAVLFTAVLSKRLNKVISKGSKVTGDNLKDIFKFQGNVILSTLYKSGLLKYDDRINDLSFFDGFKYSVKGKQSMGSTKKGKTITKKARALDPTMLGTIDITATGSSDPATSGVIVPMTKMQSMQFSEAYEPEIGIYDYMEDIYEDMESNGDVVVKCYSNKEDFVTQDEYFNDILMNFKLKRDGEFEDIVILDSEYV